jgi:hypothetical protein
MFASVSASHKPSKHPDVQQQNKLKIGDSSEGFTLQTKKSRI